MPINFTVQWDDLTNDVDDTEGDVAATAVIGWVQLIPMVREGARALAPDYSPRPASFAFRTFEGYLDTDGRLKNKRGGTAGLRVWANDPEFNLIRLPYRVEANLTDGLGRPVPFDPFVFEAPSTDTTVNLVSVMRVASITAQGVTVGPRGYPVDDVQSALGDTAAQFYVQGDPVGDPLVLPSAAWGSIIGKPAVIASGATEADARTAIGATSVGADVFTAADEADARTAIGATSAADVQADVQTGTGGIVAIERFDPDTDFAAALAAAITEADASGGTVVLETGKTYTLAAEVSVTDKHVRINGNGARIVRAATGNFVGLEVNCSHSTPQDVVAVTRVLVDAQNWPMSLDSTYVDRVEVASTAGWAAGDYAVVVGDDLIPGANPDRTPQREGERIRVTKVDATYLYLARPLRVSLTTNVRVARMTQRDCVLDNLWVEDADGFPATRNEPFIVVYGAVRPTMRNFRGHHVASIVARFFGCAAGTVDGANFFNVRTSTANGAYGYGVHLVSSCDFVVRGITGEFTRHLFTTGAVAAVAADHPDLNYYGSNLGHRIAGGDAYDTGAAAWDLHEEAADCVISDCFVGWNHMEVDGGPAAFQLRGRDSEMRNCRSIGGGGVRIVSFDGGGNFKIDNYVHTTLPEICGNQAVSGAGGLYVEVLGTDICNVEISKTRLNLPDAAVLTAWMTKTALSGSDLFIKTNQTNAASWYVFSLNSGSTIELDTLEVDLRGSGGGGTCYLFVLNDAACSVKIGRLVVRAGGAAWSIAQCGNFNATVQIDELIFDTDPHFTLVHNLGASGTAKISRIIGAGIDRDKAFTTRGDVSITMYQTSNATNRFVSALTADRTVTEGTPFVRNTGWTVTYVRASTATGAYTITVGDASLPVAGMWLRRMWIGTSWVTVGRGSLAPATTYTPTNVVTDRAYDANATTLDEVADVLGTLISDLKAQGIIA